MHGMLVGSPQQRPVRCSYGKEIRQWLVTRYDAHYEKSDSARAQRELPGSISIFHDDLVRRLHKNHMNPLSEVRPLVHDNTTDPE